MLLFEFTRSFAKWKMLEMEHVGIQDASRRPAALECRNGAVPQTPIVGVYRCISGNSKLPR